MRICFRIWILSHFNADPDPDPTFHVDADLDPDLDPACHFDADPGPDPTFYLVADPILPFNLMQIHANPDLQH